MISFQNTNLPTVEIFNNIGMDFFKEQTSDNYDEVRGRKLTQSPNSSRNASMGFLRSSTSYHERMVRNNDMDINNNNKPSPKLLYKILQEKEIHLSKATETQTNIRPSHDNLIVDNPPQCDSGNHSTLTPPQGSTTHNNENLFINIQLLYNPDVPTDLEIWNGRFHPISLHRSIKHIASDVKNIKNSLKFMAKYISNKQIKPSKANNLDDFNSIGNAVQNFISSIYKSNQDALFTNNKSNTLRKKIAAKFTPKIYLAPQRPSKENAKSTPASTKRIPPLIPAKSQKEVNVISKYFKNKQLEMQTPRNNKMYTQASKLSTSTSDVIKIKEMFPSIGVKKIGQINEIVKGNLKPKHQINMTTKGPSHKQIIIPISNDNIVKFMKNSATHIINFNRNLRNMKSEVLVDFIRSDPVGITVVTDKVSQPSDLITIEKYIKNLESINSS